MRALIVTTRHRALKAGMNAATCHHIATPDIQFWWPQLGHTCLLGLRFDLVVWEGIPDREDGQFIRSNCAFGGHVEVCGLAAESQADAALMVGL